MCSSVWTWQHWSYLPKGSGISFLWDTSWELQRSFAVNSRNQEAQICHLGVLRQGKIQRRARRMNC